MKEKTNVKEQLAEVSDTIMTINNNVLNETVFYEIKKYLYPIVKKKLILIVAIVLAAAGAGVISFKLYLGAILLVLAVLIFLEFLTLENKAVRQALAQIQGATGKDHCTYTYVLTDKAIKVRCSETDMREELPLEDFTRTADTEHAYVLFTKDSRMVVVRKDALGAKKLEQFREQIAKLCVNMEKEQEIEKA